MDGRNLFSTWLPPLHTTPLPKTFELPLVKMQSIFTRGEKRFKVCQSLGKSNGFWLAKFVSATISRVLTYALVKPKPYFPAVDLNRRFKSIAACGFFRKGGWGMTLFSPEKRVFPKKKGIGGDSKKKKEKERRKRNFVSKKRSFGYGKRHCTRS